jgi:phosphotransferase system IIA component
VLVDLGDHVKAGQPLIELDREKLFRWRHEPVACRNRDREEPSWTEAE